MPLVCLADWLAEEQIQFLEFSRFLPRVDERTLKNTKMTDDRYRDRLLTGTESAPE
jgi:hypothetical protein